MKERLGRVVHMTTVHRRYDTRIFLKECSTLSAFGYEVYLIVADGLGDEEKNGIKVLDIGRTTGRLNRILSAPKKLLPLALSLDADLYHFHDPELFSVGVKIKKADKRVVFDMHEDLPKQILNKHYLNPITRRLLSTILALYERRACKMLDYVVAATPSIREKCQAIGVQVVEVNNYPLLDELAPTTIDWQKKSSQVCYIGGITKVRGISEIVRAVGLASRDVRLVLGGEFESKELESTVASLPGWDRVDPLGFIDRRRVSEVLGSCVAGLVTFLPAPNHMNAQPNKIFEYMSAGIPLIASDFPSWRKIIIDNDCGLCVDPRNPEEIARAIDFFISQPEVAEHMGRNGRKAVFRSYNWDSEKRKLLDLYEKLCK